MIDADNPDLISADESHPLCPNCKTELALVGSGELHCDDCGYLW